MARLVSVTVVVCVIMAAGFWIDPARAQQLTFRTGARLEPLYATAIDAQRRPVSDLTKDDFVIFDNEKHQDTAVFANEVQRIRIVVMLDTSASMTGNLKLVNQAA